MRMKRFVLFVLLALCALASSAKEIQCEGTYKRHLQGIDSDGKVIYWSFTDCLLKTDMEGKILLKVEAPSHCGDPCLLNGKLYVPVNRGKFNQPKGASKDFIYVYDAETLTLQKSVPVPQYDHGVGAIAAYQGHIWVTGGLPEGAPGNIILEFTEELEYVKRYNSPGFTQKGIQTLKHLFGHWWFGVYDKPANVLCDETFQVIARPTGMSVSVGMAELPDGTFLVAKSTGTPIDKDNPKKRIWTGSVRFATFDAETKTISLRKDK